MSVLLSFLATFLRSRSRGIRPLLCRFHKNAPKENFPKFSFDIKDLFLMPTVLSIFFFQERIAPPSRQGRVFPLSPNTVFSAALPLTLFLLESSGSFFKILFSRETSYIGPRSLSSSPLPNLILARLVPLGVLFMSVRAESHVKGNFFFPQRFREPDNPFPHLDKSCVRYRETFTARAFRWTLFFSEFPLETVSSPFLRAEPRRFCPGERTTFSFG